MKKLFLFVLLCLALIVSPTFSNASNFREVKGVSSSSLIVKNAPSANASSVATLKRGDIVTVYSVTNGWAQIQSQSTAGYVNANFLTDVPSTIKIASSKSGLVVKQSPTRAANTLATLKYNMIVEDFGSVGGGWSFVQYGNVTGYVASNFIGIPKAVTEYVQVNDIVVRNIASPSGAQKATLSKGTQVNVHSTIAGWAFVSSGKTRGYVVASQLAKTKPLVLSGQKIHHDALEDDIRFTTTLRDANDQTVSVHFISYGDYGAYATEYDDIWAGLWTGELYYEGDFKIGIQTVGDAYIYVQPYTFNNYTYNKSRELVYKIQGKTSNDTDFLAVSEVGSSNFQEAQLFYMVNGQLKKANPISYTAKPKSIGNAEYQWMNYANGGDIGYYFQTFKFNKTTGSWSLVRTKSYVNEQWDQGQKIYNLWSNNPNYVVK